MGLFPGGTASDRKHCNSETQRSLVAGFKDLDRRRDRREKRPGLLERRRQDFRQRSGFLPAGGEDALFISRSSLNRRVKALLGTTPNGYVQKKRMAAAAAMLSSGKVRINEVAYAVGFNSPSYFATCFKNEFGLLPADYMNKNKQ